MPSYQKFIEILKASLQNRNDVQTEVCSQLYYKTADGVRFYDYLKIFSKSISPTDPILLIRAGIHGDEVAGVLTLMKHCGDIFDYAHARGVKLVVFPLDNPSGFEAGTRYNIEGDRGDGGNNDFVRYILDDGSVTDDLGSKNEFKAWKWSSDPVLNIHLPKETIVLHTELKKLSLRQIVGVIDFHGDNFINQPYAYHYGYGDLKKYRPSIEKIKALVPILANEYINSSYLNGPDFVPEIVKDGKIVPDDPDLKSDADGFIVRYDGSLPDLMQRLGTQHTITVETTGVIPEAVVDEVNLIWIKGLIDLIAKT